jgi:hypothetical protein
MNEDKLLTYELTKLGGLAGGIGGTLSSGLAGSVGGVLGGSAGALTAANFLPSEYHQMTIELDMSPRASLKVAGSFLRENGRVLSNRDGGE